MFISCRGKFDARIGYLPHCRAVEIHKQPLMRVEVERVCMLDSGHEVPELRAYEGGAWANQTSTVNIDSDRKSRALKLQGRSEESFRGNTITNGW
jgi:hypothetical protein